MELGARPVLLAPRPPPSLAAMERFARLETFRRAGAHRRSEMRRPLSERRAERAALAKAEMRACRSAKAACERRLDRVHEAAKIMRYAMSIARDLKRVARLDKRHAMFLHALFHEPGAQVERTLTRGPAVGMEAVGLLSKRMPLRARRSSYHLAKESHDRLENDRLEAHDSHSDTRYTLSRGDDTLHPHTLRHPSFLSGGL